MGVLSRVKIWGGRCPLKIWESKKTFKIWCFLGQLSTLTANISRTDYDIDKRSTALSTTVSSALNEKFFGELWSINQSFVGSFRPTQHQRCARFRKTVSRPLEGAAPQNFYTRHRMAKSC